MKIKSKLPKRPVVRQEIPPPNPALNADELIGSLARARDEVVKLVGKSVAELLPVILFVSKALDCEGCRGELEVVLKDGKVNYCTGADAMAEILKLFAARFYEVWNRIDALDVGVDSSVDKYRKIRPQVASK